MKKLIILSAFLVLLGINQTTLLAQSSGQADVTATAEVIVALEVNNENDLDFGQVAQGATSTVGVTDATAGRIAITGQQGVGVDVELTAISDQLLNGAFSLSINNLDVLRSQNQDGSGSTSFASTAQGSMESFTLDASTMYLFFTGEVSPPAGQEVGTYENTYTVTVSYQ